MDCETVAGCIESDSGTQDAIASAITNNTNIQNAINNVFNANQSGGTVSEEYAAQDLMDPSTECNNDGAYGHIRTAVDRWFTRVTDVLEEIELTTDNQEMLTSALDVIPVLGTGLRAAGVGSLIGWFDNVRSFLADAFTAGDTLEKRDKIACDLFCVWQANCTLSFDQVRQYFWDNAESNFPSYENAFTDITALLLAMANPTELTGTFVVDCLLATEFGFTSFINDWFGVRVEAVANDLLLGEPSDDWTVTCDDCPEVCVSPSFRIVNPLGFSGGSVEVTDNMDGTWTAVGTAAFDTNAWRLAFVEENTGCCWNTISASYDNVPDNLDAQYNCGANPTDVDYGNGIGTGPLTVDLCAAGVIASDVDEAFVLTWTFEVCP